MSDRVMLGEYYLPGSPQGTVSARYAFLSAIQNDFQALLRRLRDSDLLERASTLRENGKMMASPADLEPYLEPYLRPHNLDAPWIREQAAHSITLWSLPAKAQILPPVYRGIRAPRVYIEMVDGVNVLRTMEPPNARHIPGQRLQYAEAAAGKLSWIEVPWGWLHPTSKRKMPQYQTEWLPLSAVPWDPEIEAYDAWEARADEAYAVMKAEYRKRINKKMETAGFKRQDAVKTKLELHCRWLLYYQTCGGASQGDVAAEFSVTQPQVSRALRELGEMIGLRLKPDVKKPRGQSVLVRAGSRNL